MDQLRILTIGNSFTDSLAVFFPQVVESAGCWLQFERANHGGCELRRHWSYVEREENEPGTRLYQNNSAKLREILSRKPWDIVSIQQASHESWNQESYQPFADMLAAYVRQHAPGAELVIQQTWAYRSDDPRLIAGTPQSWGFDQTGMYDRLSAAYARLSADRNGARVIPTGFAVQRVRATDSRHFKNYDPALLTTLNWPDLPAQAGDPVGQMGWYKNRETGELFIGRDTIHLNPRGQYLQACVWFAFLYGRPVSDVRFVPDVIGAGDAAFLRDAAQYAVDNSPFKA